MISGSQVLITQQDVFEMLDEFKIKRTSYKLSFCNSCITVCFVGQRLKTWWNRKKIKAAIEEVTENFGSLGTLNRYYTLSTNGEKDHFDAFILRE